MKVTGFYWKENLIHILVSYSMMNIPDDSVWYYCSFGSICISYKIFEVYLTILGLLALKS